MPICKTMMSPGEKWCTNISERYKGTWYEACSNYAFDFLGAGDGKSCIVVGSPIAELNLLRTAGWQTMYVDVRKPPPEAQGEIKRGDIIRLPFDDAVFDAGSTSCVLTHAGLTRYGDEKDKQGDLHGLQELYRVLKPGARLSVMFGAVVAGDGPTVDWGTTHRVYTVGSATELAKAAGFDRHATSIWSPPLRRWLLEGEAVSTDPNEHDYISMSLQKP